MSDEASPTNESRPRLALLLGDCTGIGPEIVAKVLAQGEMAKRARLLVVGDARVLELGIRDAKVDFEWRRVGSPSDIDWNDSAVPVIDLANIDPAKFPQGQVSAESGKLTGESLAYAISLVGKGLIDGITFAPSTNGRCMTAAGNFPTSIACLPASSGTTATSAK
jgi:4-hydroxythreonine-4-phosphate dehydrogenase